MTRSALFAFSLICTVLLAVLLIKRAPLRESAATEALDCVESLAFSSDGHFLVSGSGYDQNVVQLWSMPNLKSIETLPGHDAMVHCVAFAPNGRAIASASRDKLIKLWDVHGRRHLTNFVGHTDEVYSVAFSPNGQLLLSGSLDQTVRLWRISTGKVHRVVSLQSPAKSIAERMAYPSKVSAVSFSRDGKSYAAASWDKTVRVWDTETGDSLAFLRGHNAEVYALAYGFDSATIASAGREDLLIWNVREGKIVADLNRKNVSSLAYRNSGDVLAVGYSDGYVELFNARSFDSLTVFRVDERNVHTVAFSPDGKVLATGGFDRFLRLWSVAGDY